jgi:hypothetical protein
MRRDDTVYLENNSATIEDGCAVSACTPLSHINIFISFSIKLAGKCLPGFYLSNNIFLEVVVCKRSHQLELHHSSLCFL